MTSKVRKTIRAVRYLIASTIPVAGVWAYELGREGFNALMRDPLSNPFSWFILTVALLQAACQAVGALMNADTAKGGSLPKVPQLSRMPGGKGPDGKAT